MALDMVDTDQRFFQRIGECLRFRYTDEQGTDEARTIGYRDGIDVVEGTVCFLQRERDDVSRCLREAISGTTPPYSV